MFGVSDEESKEDTQQTDTYTYRKKIADDITNLDTEHLLGFIDIIKDDKVAVETDHKEIEIDIEKLSNQTLHKLASYIQSNNDSQMEQIQQQMRGIDFQTSVPEKSKIPVDDFCPKKNVTVVNNMSVFLNQTNIASNNNKFYMLQLVSDGLKFFVFSRWGRVGEKGNHLLNEFDTFTEAEARFKTKFHDKTGNEYGQLPYTPKPRRFVVIELDW